RPNLVLSSLDFGCFPPDPPKHLLQTRIALPFKQSLVPYPQQLQKHTSQRPSLLLIDILSTRRLVKTVQHFIGETLDPREKLASRASRDVLNQSFFLLLCFRAASRSCASHLVVFANLLENRSCSPRCDLSTHYILCLRTRYINGVV